MHVLITGGAGFIGSHSAEALLANNAKVTVFDNFSSGKESNLPKHEHLKIVRGDIRNIDELQDALSGVTHVLHLAAQVSVQASVDNPPLSCMHNVVGFVNVVQAARQAQVKRVVYASSAAVYGVPISLPLSEQSTPAPISPYGLEKLINDQYAGLFRSLFSQSLLGLRYFNVYGPRQDPSSPYAGVISKFASLLQQRKPLHVFGDGKQTRDFVFVKDVAQINVKALNSDYCGICNVGTGSTVSLLELIDALSECVDEKAEVVFDPPLAGDIRDSAMMTEHHLKVFGSVPNTTLSEGLRTLFS